MFRMTSCRVAGVLALVLCCAVAPSVTAQAGDPETEQPPARFLLSEFSLTLSRAFHTWECPSYTIEVGGPGWGQCSCRKMRVGRDRSTQFHVPEDAVRELLRTLFQGDFFRLRSEYCGSPVVSVDPSGVVQVGEVRACPNPGRVSAFTVRIGAYTKSVIVRPGEHPDVLDSLEEQLDLIAGGTYREIVGTEGG